MPTKNRDALLALEGELTRIYRKHIVLRYQFLRLSEPGVFEGFTDLDRVVSAESSEEAWIELEEYREDARRKAAAEAIGQDPEAGLLPQTLIDTFGEASALFFCTLKEAEVFNGGRRLGPLGGRIVAQVLIGLLREETRIYDPGPHRVEPGLLTKIRLLFTLERKLRRV